jgi:hypothetical protein
MVEYFDDIVYNPEDTGCRPGAKPRSAYKVLPVPPDAAAAWRITTGVTRTALRPTRRVLLRAAARNFFRMRRHHHRVGGARLGA